MKNQKRNNTSTFTGWMAVIVIWAVTGTLTFYTLKNVRQKQPAEEPFSESLSAEETLIMLTGESQILPPPSVIETKIILTQSTEAEKEKEGKTFGEMYLEDETERRVEEIQSEEIMEPVPVQIPKEHSGDPPEIEEVFLEEITAQTERMEYTSEQNYLAEENSDLSERMICRYQFTAQAGNVVREDDGDFFTVSFHRNRSGEVLTFEMTTGRDEWLDAISARYPAEDPAYAQQTASRYSVSGAVYSYCVSDFPGGRSYISIFPEDRIVLVEEGGRPGYRVYTAEGYSETLFQRIVEGS